MLRTTLIAAIVLVCNPALAQSEKAGDRVAPLPASRLAVMPATSHTAVINQPELLRAFIEPFLSGETPKGMFE